jgi:PEP-CTERM motif
MARIGCRFRFPIVRPFVASGDVKFAVALALSVGFSLAAPPRSDAAKLSSFLTPKDLARPLLLDQNGQQLQLPSGHHPLPAFPQGSTPTYLVIPLSGGEHLPAATNTIFTGQGGPAVGPLDFNASVKAQVDNALATSGLVAVDTPHQNYVVEYLPRLSRSLAGSSTAAGASTRSTSAPAATTNSASNELSQFLGGNLSISQIAKNTVNGVESLLHFKSSKPTATKPSLNLEAQVIDPTLPAPIPEPSSWLLFGLTIGAVALHRQLRRRARPRNQVGGQASTSAAVAQPLPAAEMN